MKIAIIGCGGIGSFLARELFRLVMNEQISIDTNIITLIDDDIVELKNIKYQNFERGDIGKSKSRVLAERFCFDFLETKITTHEQLKEFDFIVCCVDNALTRKMIFEYCEKNGVYFIDGRSEGRAIGIFTKHTKNTLTKLLSTLNTNAENTSCQLKFELDKGIIQNGNLICATILSQMILNKLRDIENPSEVIFYF